MSYFLNYGINLKSFSNKAASKGTITHKQLEFLAYKKLAQQNRKRTFQNETLGKIPIGIVTEKWALNQAWEEITKKENHLKWENRDYKDCEKWGNEALTFNNGQFNPKNQNIVVPELFFDLEKLDKERIGLLTSVRNMMI
jgi:hypothetical protein